MANRQNERDRAALDRLLGHDEEPRGADDPILGRAVGQPGSRLPSLEQIQNREEAILASLQEAQTEYPTLESPNLGDETDLGEVDLTTSGGRSAMLRPARSSGERYAGFNQGTGISGPNQAQGSASGEASNAAAVAGLGRHDKPQRDFGQRGHLATGLGNIENFGPSQPYMPGGEKTAERRDRVSRMTAPDSPNIEDIRARLAALEGSFSRG